MKIKGKRGGLRVIYYWWDGNRQFWLFTLYVKDELFEIVREMMRSRSLISHGLLKEQLKAKGYSVPNLSKLVDQLIREGKLASAGGGNYALGKKA